MIIEFEVAKYPDEIVTPDTYYRRHGNVTFIYTYSGDLVVDDRVDMPHDKMIAKILRDDVGYFNDALEGKKFHVWDDDVEGTIEVTYHDFPNLDYYQMQYITDSIRVDAEEHSLLGRISKGKVEVAFWNPPDQLHGLLEPCLKELLDKNLIDKQTEVVLGGNAWIGTIRNLDISTHGLTPEQQRILDLHKRLHLMPPDEKKKAMKELGLRWKSTKNPWQREAEKAELVKPGQKWWAPTSEGKQ